MEDLINPKTKLPNLVQDLKTNLTALQPKSETAQLITYTLLATAVVGIMVYHYIREQSPDSFSQEKGLENEK